jgi:HSP90 family molecular chaperone
MYSIVCNSLMIPEALLNSISGQITKCYPVWYVVTETKTKTVKETKWDWETLNDAKAVWLRNPKDVTAEEYDKFYRSLAKVRFLLSIQFSARNGHCFQLPRAY